MPLRLNRRLSLSFREMLYSFRSSLRSLISKTVSLHRERQISSSVQRELTSPSYLVISWCRIWVTAYHFEHGRDFVFAVLVKLVFESLDFVDLLQLLVLGQLRVVVALPLFIPQESLDFNFPCLEGLFHFLDGLLDAQRRAREGKGKEHIVLRLDPPVELGVPVLFDALELGHLPRGCS